ncbi:HD domain-containing protein [soil metagenome]
MADPGRRSISQIRTEVRAGALRSRVHAQVEELVRKEDRNAKPYYEVKVRDGGDSLSLKAWNSTPQFGIAEELQPGEGVEIEGEFSLGSFGLDVQRWTLQPLSETELAALVEGDDATRALNERDQADLMCLVESITDPRLRELAMVFFNDFGPRFLRAAAARFNHHAFRGGLLRHTAQMMRSAAAIAGAYPRLNRDLLLTGVLFHDTGKLWEMCPTENGFDMPRELRGELLGHVSIGIELVNSLWRKLPLDEWKDLTPSSDDVRLHLLHLIASHHGELQYGAPVEPKTAEAIALHYVDNLDARLEMIFNAYDKQPETSPGMFDRVRALNVAPVRSLPFIASEPSGNKPEE